jgi:arylsulfatase A-like enzyme/tetratricopeptide (TPR) repeat protein
MRFGRGTVLVVSAVSAGVGVLAAAWWRGHPDDPATTVARHFERAGIARPDVVLVTLDTTRVDHLGAYGSARARTPHLDALARRGVVFEHAATPAPLTQPAHASLLTGTYPPYHGLRVNGGVALAQAHFTLAEALHARGYATGAFLGAFVLDGRWGLGQGFDVYDDRFPLDRYEHVDLGGVQRRGDEVMDLALRWMEQRGDGPLFAWIHLYDAHTPYEPPEPFLSEYGAAGPAGLYAGEVAFVDSQIGRLSSWLRAAGREERTIVVVAGDHGEALGSHGEGTHGFFVYDYAVHVPLIVAAPLRALRGVRVREQVSLVDVMPTVLALVGAAPAPAVQGRSLLPAMFRSHDGGTSYAYAEAMTANLQFGWSPLLTLRTPRYKLIKAPRPELYDLAADPGETTNVIARHTTIADDMMARLDRLAARSAEGAPRTEAADLDKDTLAGLAALGYVGGLGPAPAAGTPSLADPKDKLAVFAAVQEAGEKVVRDDHASAARLLESALAQEPEMPQARLLLATAYSEMGRPEEARAEFDRVLRHDGRNVPALVGLANLLQGQGRTDDVMALARQTLALDDRNTQALTLLGEAHVERGAPREALPWFERALAVQPKLTQNRLNVAACLVDLRRYADAEAALQDILRESPRFPLARFNLGLLYEEQGRTEEARAAYTAEVRDHPRGFKARFNLGNLLLRAGDLEGAEEQMRAVVEVAPDRAEGHLFLARVLLRRGALAEVEAHAAAGLARARTPEHRTFGWLLMADVYSRRGQRDEVAKALRKAGRPPTAAPGGSHANPSD